MVFKRIADVPTGNNEEVMVDLVIKAKQGFRSNFIVETPKDGKDLTLVRLLKLIVMNRVLEKHFSM